MTAITERRIVRGCCPLDCPDTCGWEVTVEHGLPASLRGSRDYPFTRGSLCAKIYRYLDHLRQWIAWFTRCDANPVASNPGQAKLRRGLERADLFTDVIDHFQTDTADYADLRLPTAMQPEHADIHDAYGHLYLMCNEPAVAPPGECLPNTPRVHGGWRGANDYRNVRNQRSISAAIKNADDLCLCA